MNNKIEYDEFIGCDESYLEKKRVEQEHKESIYNSIMYGHPEKPVVKFQGMGEPL